MSAVCFSAVSEHSIKRAHVLVSDRLQEIAHHRATAGLQEHHDGHSRHQLQAAKPPSLATGQRQPDFIVSCIATGLPIAAQIGRDIRHDHSCGFAKSGRHVGGPRRQANRSPPRTDAERHCIRGRCPGNGQRGSAGCRRCMREITIHSKPVRPTRLQARGRVLPNGSAATRTPPFGEPHSSSHNSILQIERLGSASRVVARFKQSFRLEPPH